MHTSDSLNVLMDHYNISETLHISFEKGQRLSEEKSVAETFSQQPRYPRISSKQYIRLHWLVAESSAAHARIAAVSLARSLNLALSPAAAAATVVIGARARATRMASSALAYICGALVNENTSAWERSGRACVSMKFAAAQASCFLFYRAARPAEGGDA